MYVRNSTYKVQSTSKQSVVKSRGQGWNCPQTVKLAWAKMTLSIAEFIEMNTSWCRSTQRKERIMVQTYSIHAIASSIESAKRQSEESFRVRRVKKCSERRQKGPLRVKYLVYGGSRDTKKAGSWELNPHHFNPCQILGNCKDSHQGRIEILKKAYTSKIIVAHNLFYLTLV